MSWKFSLKTMLIALALIVVGLVFFVEPYLRLKKQNEAIEALFSNSELIERDDADNVIALMCGIPNSGGNKVDLLTIVVENFDGLEQFGNLESLTFNDCELYSFEGLEKLQALASIEFSSVSPVAPELTKLDLTPLQECQSLKELIFPNSVSSETIKRYQETLPNCKVFKKQE